MPKRGDIRVSDGRLFFGYKKNPTKPGQFYEWWLNPESYHRKLERTKVRSSEIQKENYKDPVKGPLMRQASRENMARRRKAAPELMMLIALRHKCKHFGFLFDLELEDIVIPIKCPALGIGLSRGVGKVGDASPTIDRIKPSLGYTKGNIVVISHLANRIKSNATAAQVMKVAKFMAAGK